MTKRRVIPGSVRPSPSNVLANLPAAQLREFIGWLVNNETYASAQTQLKERFGVSISEHTISQFWKKYVAPEIGQRDEFIRAVVREHMQQRLAGGSGSGAKGGAER